MCLGRIVEQLMRQIMQYDGEFRREEATPQSALARSTEAGSDRVEHSSPPGYAGQAGVFSRAGGDPGQTLPRSCRQLQNIRLGSAAANPFNRNRKAD